MVIVKLMGGLGNQMFQYAAAKALAAHLNTTFKLDLEFLLDRTPRENFVFRDYDLDIFSLEADMATAEETAPFKHSPKKLDRYLRIFKNNKDSYRYYFEPHFHYTPDFFRLPANTYLDGYWQTPRYFSAIHEQIKRDFAFREPVAGNSLELVQIIRQEDAVCVNVRRGDFLSNNFHGVCDMKYFNPAIEIMASKLNNPHFFIFSDDPEWCLNNFKLPYSVTFVNHEHAGRKFSHYLQLMSMCKHFIISNSSFAWWAVWLNNNSDRLVIAPKTWFTDISWDERDLVPREWIRVNN